jgi:hypothetical protein
MVERMLTSIHIFVDNIPMMCEYIGINEDRTRRLILMLEKYGFIKSDNEYMWLTKKGIEWRDYLNSYLSS